MNARSPSSMQWVHLLFVQFLSLALKTALCPSVLPLARYSGIVSSLAVLALTASYSSASADSLPICCTAPRPGLLWRSTTNVSNFHPRCPLHNNHHVTSTAPAASAVRTKMFSQRKNYTACSTVATPPPALPMALFKFLF